MDTGEHQPITEQRRKTKLSTDTQKKLISICYVRCLKKIHLERISLSQPTLLLHCTRIHVKDPTLNPPPFAGMSPYPPRSSFATCYTERRKTERWVRKVEIPAVM